MRNFEIPTSGATNRRSAPELHPPYTKKEGRTSVRPSFPLYHTTQLGEYDNRIGTGLVRPKMPFKTFIDVDYSVHCFSIYQGFFSLLLFSDAKV